MPEPLQTPVAQQATVQAIVAPVPEKIGRRTVLLVEDDALIRINTAEMLQDAGLIVVEAGSAEEAKAALQTMAVDVLVTDLNLPGASGCELAAEARALRPTTLIVYATGDPSSVVGEQDAIVVSKPYDAAKLAKNIAEGETGSFSEAKVASRQTSGEEEEV